MLLYLLRRTDSPIGYDEAAGMVVCARSLHAARNLAVSKCMVEGPLPWLRPDRSTCTLLGAAVPSIAAGVILVESRDG